MPIRALDVREGITYLNRGAGNTRRKVLRISDEERPRYYYGETRPSEPGVLYVDQSGQHGQLYLSSFAQWVGKALGPDDERNL